MSPRIATRPRTASLTHPGYRREENEDRLLVRELDRMLLLAVADGMGGQPGGDTAAQLAVDTLAAFAPDLRQPEEGLVEAMEAANERVLAEATGNPALKGMGCTLTAALVMEMELFWGQVGDSRLYLQRQGEKLRQLTTDQNLAQRLVAAGRLTPEEARHSVFRHMLDQCVGCPVCLPESGRLPLEEGDLLLLCTDGLYGELADMELADRLAGPEILPEKAESLVQAALAAGGQDNITVVLAAW